MTEPRKITRDDVLIKTRLLAEGVRYDVKGTAVWQPQLDGFMKNPNVVLDGCGLVAASRPNPHSIIDLTLDGNDVTISELGKVVATGKLEPRPAWFQELMSDGTTVGSAWSGTALTSNIMLSGRCHSFDIGKGCRFCGLYAQSLGQDKPLRETLQATERYIEATAIAARNGWLGHVTIVGGALPPERRGRWMTDFFEAVMDRFREYLDDATMAQLGFGPQAYPPDDFSEMEKWKSLGITGAVFDMEIMDPLWFKAVCPGKGDQKRWLAAQEAAVEVFGSCATALVAGIEPMAGMLEGIEERISKGVLAYPMIFQPMAGAPMEGMRPASAEWYMEAYEKIAAIYARRGYESEMISDDALAFSWAD